MKTLEGFLVETLQSHEVDLTDQERDWLKGWKEEKEKSPLWYITRIQEVNIDVMRFVLADIFLYLLKTKKVPLKKKDVLYGFTFKVIVLATLTIAEVNISVLVGVANDLVRSLGTSKE